MKALARLWPEERIALAFFGGVAALFIVRHYPFTVGPLVASYLQFLLAISACVHAVLAVTPGVALTTTATA